MTQYQFVGVDVAKDKFDVALEIDGKYKLEVFANDKKGYQAFVKWLNKYTTQPWVCMEATGHYSELIADYLYSVEIKVSVINPLQIKSFARAKLSRNKTDQLDAILIATYGEMMKPRLFTPRSEANKQLKELTNLLDMFKAQHTQLSNQRSSAQSSIARKMVDKAIKTLMKEIKKVEELIAEIIKDNQELNENLELITSIKGVGKLTAYKILSLVPHLQNFRNAKQFAAFIGITPRQHQSGNSKGKTVISRLGNPTLRKALFMAAMVAMRFNPSITPFINRLRANKKAPKAIICAVMRKLAHLIFGVLKNKRRFDANFA